MSKKIIAVNASPRKGWNTDTMVTEAAKGAEAAGAEVTYVDLYKLGHFTGCLSCFSCKTEAHKGHCVIKDALTPVLDAIREADGLIMGSPNYLGEMSAHFRAFYERLVYQNLTYNKEKMSSIARRIPVLLIMTSNFEDTHYLGILEEYRIRIERYLGPAEIFVCGDTVQIADYEKQDWAWNLFDVEQKRIRRETIFPEECRKAFELGAKLARQ